MGYQRGMHQADRIKFTITPNGKGKEFLIFGEEEKDILLDSSSTVTDKQVQSWIDDKYQSGYFNTAKSALQILLNCKAYFDEPVRPESFANDMENYTKKKNLPR